MDGWYQVTQLLLVFEVLVEYWIFIIINDTSCAAIVSLYFFVVEKNHVAKVLNSLMYVTAFLFWRAYVYLNTTSGSQMWK